MNVVTWFSNFEKIAQENEWNKNQISRALKNLIKDVEIDKNI
ncbi:hypothetical protein AAJ76_2090001283 [Vairimorpha ceranae]|uniref:Uncharacterized protein n=1 Tax=Vairimorpha ceranae TaxID=40302 RepID=A0A0F9YM26_9MICR|nr:hypothetical protein AAJ76_2090001283 [Vairimorpha ceranae]KKO73837.1 hypothetical protein AAJ76_2090001283 [Vairimorpha ceranae]